MRCSLLTLLLLWTFSSILPAATPGNTNLKNFPNESAFTLQSNHLATKNLTAAAAVDTRFFVSSNTQSMVGVFDIDGSTVSMSAFNSTATDADGIYYDAGADVLYQLNRSLNVINAYSNVKMAIANGVTPDLTATSSSDFVNGREIAVVDGKLIVAQDDNGSNGGNRFFIYNISPTAITLDKTYDADINLWGIHIDGTTLFAIEDNSNRVAIYSDFFNNTNGTTVSPDMMVSVENLVRTHGITYDSESDILFLTDIGDAASDADGAIVVIKKFTAARADGTISAGEQIRNFGGSSRLGNPVDIAYDKTRNRIYIAERARDGGRVLGFNFPALSGGIAPFYNELFPGASAIHIPDNGADLCGFVDGGSVSFTTGGTTQTIIIDGQPDMLSFNSTVDPMASGHSFTYVVTDANGMILGIPPGNTVDFDPAGLGACLVYGVSYTGNLLISMGNDFSDPNLQISDDCFDVSGNFLTVNRIAPQVAVAQFFASSNTMSEIGAFNILNDNTITRSSFTSVAGDADGIFYDEDADVLYQLNRSDNVINAYSNVNDSLATGGTLQLTATSTSDFSNGRGIAVTSGKLIVAQDDSGTNSGNRFVIYDISPTAITLDKIYDADINLWGLFANGNTLYAIQDNSNNIAVYQDFFDNMNNTTVSPTFTVSVDNLVRTHGLTYSADRDMMILTDIGDAGSDSDGALVVIRNFTIASANFNINSDEQVRVSGGGSHLGNPVDVAFDNDRNRVYVAERANGGGRILGFKLPNLSGGIAPTYNQLFAGVSSIYLPGLEVGRCDYVDGGKVAFENGGTETTIFIDGNPDVLSFSSTIDPMTAGYSFTYVITDASGMVLGVPPANSTDFDPAGVGACLVYGVSYTGNLLVTAMDDFNDPNLQLSDECFTVSDNFLTVNRIAPEAPEARMFVSSNTTSTIGVYNVLGGNNIVANSFGIAAMDADGIFYDEDADVLYQLNRTDNVINAYSNVSDSLAVGAAPLLTATSTSDFFNGREIAVNNTKLIVAQDADPGNGNQNQLLVYDISPTAITLDRVFNVTINLWGLHVNVGTLYAVVDNSNQVAVFNDIFNQAAGALAPNVLVSIENLVRTHGLTYDADADMMILTDVGSAASATDGAIVVVKGFTAASADGTVTASEQIRVFGAASALGNPVDVAFDKDHNRIYVAERANGGGRILGFKLPVLSGGIAPTYNQLFAGASAIHLPHPSVDNLAGPGNSSLVENAANRELTPATIIFDKLYPVPTTSILNLSIESTLDQQTTILIFDARGALVQTNKTALYPGLNNIVFDVNDLNTGVHYISIPAIGFNERFLKVIE